MNENRDKIKSEIIQGLLFEYVKSIGLKYDNYFKIIDDNIVSDDEMYIFIDVWDRDECDDVYGNPISDEGYKQVLRDFKKYCDEFIDRLEFPKNLLFSPCYFEKTDEDLGDEVFYKTCELHCRIVGDDV